MTLKFCPEWNACRSRPDVWVEMTSHLKYLPNVNEIMCGNLSMRLGVSGSDHTVNYPVFPTPPLNSHRLVFLDVIDFWLKSIYLMRGKLRNMVILPPPNYPIGYLYSVRMDSRGPSSNDVEG
jgi:hypothetical protein